MKDIIEFLINTFGIFIIYMLIDLKNKTFKELFYILCLVLLACILIRIELN